MRPVFETLQFDGVNATRFAALGAADAAFKAGGAFGESKAPDGGGGFGGEEGKVDGGVGLGSPDNGPNQELHLEPLVDDMRAQKDAELEKYCKTVEQRQRFRGR